MSWISINDKLPEEFSEVLAYDTETKKIIVACFFYDEKSDGLMYREWNTVPHDNNFIGFITHWMPLPEPPK